MKRTSPAPTPISAQWLAAQHHYELLHAEGIVDTVDASVLSDPQAADELVADGLEADLYDNRAAPMLFRGRRRWQMLEARLPPSALDKRFRPRPAAPGWTGEPVVEVPYAVGASVTLTYALAIAHEIDAIPMTDKDASHRLLLLRLARAAAEQGDVPALHAEPRHPYTRRQIEVRLIDELAPAAVLHAMDFEDVLEYRRDTEPARRELTGWIDKLVREAHGRPLGPQAARGA